MAKDKSKIVKSYKEYVNGVDTTIMQDATDIAAKKVVRQQPITDGSVVPGVDRQLIEDLLKGKK